MPESERRQGKGSRPDAYVYQVLSLQSHGKRCRRRQHGDVDGPRVHLCNADPARVGQHVEAGTQRLPGRSRVHICNRLQTAMGVALPLHVAVALLVLRMGRSIVMVAFLDSLCASLKDDGPMHRLWYDLRSQSTFEPAFREDVEQIDKSLCEMVSRVMHRFAALAGAEPRISDAGLYALFDGLFQHALVRHFSGAPDAIAALRSEAEAAVRQVIASENMG